MMNGMRILSMTYRHFQERFENGEMGLKQNPLKDRLKRLGEAKHCIERL